jgi:hypothetical protein
MASPNTSIETDLTEGKNLNAPHMQCFLVKSNLTIDLRRFADYMIVRPGRDARSGTIVALKYQNDTRGAQHLFKKKSVFKNSVQLIMSFRGHSDSTRLKKLVNIKISSIGTFQVLGVQIEDVSKIVFKIFTLMEKQNRYNIFTYYVALRPSSEQSRSRSSDIRLEIVIANILANYVLELDPRIVNKLYSDPITIFRKHNFICFKIPTDHAITIKKSFEYNEFKHLPVPYITWYKRYGKIERFIEYDSFATLSRSDLIEGRSVETNCEVKRYVNIRVFRTGKAIISGFHEMLVERAINEFLYIFKDKFTNSSKRSEK